MVIGHVGRDVGNRGVDHARIDLRKLFGVVAAIGDLRAQFRIAEIGEVDLVELQIAAAGVGKGAHRLGVGCPEIAIEIVHDRINAFRHRVAAIAEMQARRRRDRHLRHHARMRGEKFEMLEHRVAGERAELAGDPQHHRLRVDALELDLALAEIGFDPGQRAQKIVIPEGAAEFAVGRGLEPDVLLPLDDLFDLAVFDLLERGGGDFAPLTFRPRFLQRRSAQQAADVVGAERRRRPRTHAPHTSLAMSTIKASFAHCSSSASTLPSSVEAKPHCGDSAS